MSTVAGKVAVVTGAGSGIGRALAIELAHRGAKVALSDVNADNVAVVASEVAGLGAEVHSARLDVTDAGAVTAYAETVAAHFGVVHQIYNNAGIAYSKPITDTSFEDYERVFAVNLWGVIHGTKAFLPHLIASGDGHVTNISSLNGILAQVEMSHYCATKFAVRGFTETLALEMRQQGHPVKVSVVHPGGIKTNIASAAGAAERSRTGQELDAAARAREKAYNDKLLKMPASKAAQIIVGGVEKDRLRILVGSDAKAVDRLVRLSPTHAPRLLADYFKRMFKN